MAEAAMVLPLIIVFSILSIAAMVFYSDSARNAASMSIHMRSVSGADSKTVCCLDSGLDISEGQESWQMKEKNLVLSRYIDTEYESCLYEKKVFGIDLGKKVSLEHSCINEAETLWKKQLVEELMDG